MTADDELRYALLRFFLPEARTIGDLVCHEGTRHHGRRRLRRLVYALTDAGLLDCWGCTSGRTYRTSHLGYVVLATLHECLDRKPHSPPHDEVHW